MVCCMEKVYTNGSIHPNMTDSFAKTKSKGLENGLHLLTKLQEHKPFTLGSSKMILNKERENIFTEMVHTIRAVLKMTSSRVWGHYSIKTRTNKTKCCEAFGNKATYLPMRKARYTE